MEEIDQEDIEETSTLTSYIDEYIEQISKLREENNKNLDNQILKYRIKTYKEDKCTTIISMLYLSLFNISVIYLSFVLSKLFILFLIITIIFMIFILLDFIKTRKELKEYLKERDNSINEEQD